MPGGRLLDLRRAGLGCAAGCSEAGSTLLTQAFAAGYRMRESLRGGVGISKNGKPEPGSVGALQDAFRWFCEPDPKPVRGGVASSRRFALISMLQATIG